MTLIADESSSTASPAPKWGQSTLVLGPRERSKKVPGFLVPPERFWATGWSSLRVLFTPDPPPTSARPLLVVHHIDLVQSKRADLHLAASVVIHCLVILLLFQFSYAAARNRYSPDTASDSQEKIYYSMNVLDAAKPLPRIQPRGAGAHPDEGQFPHLRPALGNTASNRVLAAVSKPLHPDNARQTIVQPSSPPNLKITAELKLPNIIDGMVAAGPSAPSQLYASMAKPIAANRSMPAAAAPTVTAPAPTAPLAFLPDAGNNNPRLPVTPLAAPARSQVSARQSAPAPNIDSGGPAGAAVNGGGLFIMSVDPAPPAAQLALPPGNRSAAFSVSPEDGLIGSPTGSASGFYGGGTGAGKEGGNGSVGPGAGTEGGGGGPSASEGTISAKFVAEPAAAPGALDPAFAASMVFPVLASAIPRKNAMVVSAGPIGGGGLDVYGALHCGKIYTIFLSMPGKSWTLQYCEHQDASVVSGVNPSAMPPKQPSQTAIALPSPLVPPDPESRFDFKRVPTAQDKPGKMIVLKGALKDDGAVDALQVYQGVAPEMDEAARLAFSRWKFKPAMRGGKPVALDILVGIYPEGPAAPSTPSTPSAH